MAYKIIATYSSEIEAEVAKATLASNGIGAFIKVDDAGGMYPILHFSHGVTLYVDEEDFDLANEILSEGNFDSQKEE